MKNPYGKFPNPLLEVNVWKKIDAFHTQANEILRAPENFLIPSRPGREEEVLEIHKHPPKPGLASNLGRGRLLHDLASIELQAFELGVRTLIEFPDAPNGFREELLSVTLEEAKHLKLCLEGLDHLGFEFGHWPIHLSLWDAVSTGDDLMDRILIVHRYLEGSGLDASEIIFKRLSGVEDKVVKNVVKVIADEEIGHVRFGSDWYRKIAIENGIEPESDFEQRLLKVIHQIPRRLEPIEKNLRMKAGFSAAEIAALERLQAGFRAKLQSRPQIKIATPPQANRSSE